VNSRLLVMSRAATRKYTMVGQKYFKERGANIRFGEAKVYYI